MSWVRLELLALSADLAANKGLLPLTDDLFQHEEFISEALKFLGTSLESQSSDTLKNPRRFKDNQQSSSLREQGNQFFCSSSDLKNLEQALELYTKSIAYATPGSTELALAYANRAYALLKLNRPKECLEDLDRASENNYPKDLESKLWARRGDAYAKLEEYNYIAAKHWLNETPLKGRKKMEEVLENYSASNYKDTIDVVPKVPVLQSPSDEYPFCSDAIEIQYSGKFDKKVVATRDIDVTETLILDVPYSLTPLTQYFYTHCSYCMDSFFNGIPCDGCIHVLYCSGKCKDLAWKEYHCFECPVRDCVMQVPNYWSHLTEQMSRTPRLLLQMQHEAGGLQQLKERVIGFYRNDSNGDSDKDRWYRERSLETVLMADSNIFNAPPERMGLAALIALCTLYYLGTTTNFFGIQYTVDSDRMKNVVAMSQNPDVKFTGALLLKLTLILWNNSLTRNEAVLGDMTKYFRGILFLPLSGTIKPECHYNISAQCLQNYYVVHCTRPIKRGEELTTPFGREWFNHTKAERKERLMNYKSILCNCLACTRNWPTLENSPTIQFQALTLSRESKAKIARVMLPFMKLQVRIHNGDIPEPKRTLAELKRMFKEVYEEVDFPYFELTSIFGTIPAFYQMTGNLSKLKKLHTTPNPFNCIE